MLASLLSQVSVGWVRDTEEASSSAWTCGTQEMEDDGHSLPIGVVLSEENGSWGWEVTSCVARDRLLGRGFVLHAERLPR